MTNIKSLAGATALLLLIAVIDNFLVIEQEPRFEGMALVEANAEKFWIDRQAVDADAFEQFVAASNYDSENAESTTESQVELLPIEFASADAQDDWQKKTDAATWQRPLLPEEDLKLSLSPEHSGMQITVNAARAYCNWLDKEFPTEAQYKLAAQEAAEIFEEGEDFDPHLLSGDASHNFLAKFRCVISQIATTD